MRRVQAAHESMRDLAACTRRKALLAGIAGLLPLTFGFEQRRAVAGASAAAEIEKSFRLGVIADLHHGLAPTALPRLEAFIEAMQEQSVDAILQLGDFCYGKPDSEPCLRVWREFAGPKYHVLGNHDMDFFGKPHMLEQWEMPKRYDSFDAGAFHFVILDRNHLFRNGKYEPYDSGNFYVDGKYRGYVDPEQLEWLREDLTRTERPTVIFTHQGLGMPTQQYPVAAANRPLEELFAAMNRDRSRPKVVACFCGHHHIDRYHFRGGTHYVWINSASYYWVGAKYGRMAAYRDPLFCVVDFHPDGTIEITGRETTWEEPSPAERGVPEAAELNTLIKDRKLEVST